MSQRSLKVALLGFGTVGASVAKILVERPELAGRLQLTHVFNRDVARKRAAWMPGSVIWTDDYEQVLSSAPDIVVEVVGGVNPAREWVSRAIERGSSVVTANKMLLAAHGPELLRAAAVRGVELRFEAAVAGGVPLIHGVREGLAGDRLTGVAGILNGTCNYILTRMTEERLPFAKALAEAQSRGFAEADPTLDLDGHDAAQKLQLLAEIAFNVVFDRVKFPVEGIRPVELEDIRSAHDLGYVIKHIAVAKDLGETLDIRVHPALLPLSHPLAHVREEFNSVLLRGDAVDEMIFTGKGAGSLPTASALLSDIIDIARHGDAEMWHLPTGREKPLAADVPSKYYLRFPIKDVPGVIGQIATALGARGISISHAAASLREGKAGYGNVKILAHDCGASALRAALAEIGTFPVLTGTPVVLRVFEEG